MRRAAGAAQVMSRAARFIVSGRPAARQARHLGARQIVIIWLLLGGYDRDSALSSSAPGRDGQPFASR